MDRPPVQYAETPSGARIAFAIRGTGQAVVLPPYTTWTLHPPRAVPRASDLWQLASGARLMAFNHVGVGLSQRTGYDFSLDGLVEELRAVVEAADLRDFVLLASGCAGPPAIKYAVEHPDRIKHLILRETWPSSAKPARKRLMMFGAAIEAGDWDAASQGYARLGWNLSGPEADAVAEGIRSAIEPETLLAYFRCVAEHDVSDVLGDLCVPTTVMRRAEPSSPLRTQAHVHSDALAHAIPGARLWLTDDPPWDWRTYSAVLDDETARGSDSNAHRLPSRNRGQARGADHGGAQADASGARAASPVSVVLTPKEEEVLALIARGDTNREIASALGIVEGTVKRHVSNLLRKTDLKHRRQLMRWADHRNGAVDRTP